MAIVLVGVARGDLSNEEWARLGPHLPKNVGRGGRWKNHRRVINGILFRSADRHPVEGSADAVREVEDGS